MNQQCLLNKESVTKNTHETNSYNSQVDEDAEVHRDLILCSPSEQWFRV
jgi:hypothetical protein